MLQLKETPASRKTLQKFTNDKKSKKNPQKTPRKKQVFLGRQQRNETAADEVRHV